MEKAVKPISPSEIIENLDKIIPPVVIQAVNNLLTDKFRGHEVMLCQNDIISEIQRLDNNISRDEIFKKHLLDFEGLYEKNGWSVKYDKPGFNENYIANFIFKQKK